VKNPLAVDAIFLENFPTRTQFSNSLKFRWQLPPVPCSTATNKWRKRPTDRISLRCSNWQARPGC